MTHSLNSNTQTQYTDGLLELKQLNNWVVSSKKSKIPLQVGGDSASATDSDTWNSYLACRNSLINAPQRFQYVGYVFTSEDPFCGIDLDNSIDENGEIKDYAQEIINLLSPCYVEYSKSKKGLHIIIKGKKPIGRSRTGKDNNFDCEIYDTGRYFVITENVIQNEAPIEKQKELETLYYKLFPKETTEKKYMPTVDVNVNDEDLYKVIMNDKTVQKILSSPKYKVIGSKEVSLWSDLDLSLCNKLAFYCGRDFDKIDTMFKKIGSLYRDKWDRPDYKKRTIDCAIQGCSETFNPDFNKDYINIVDDLEEWESLQAGTTLKEIFKKCLQFNFNDDTIADYFVEKYKNILLFHDIDQCFYKYDNGVWRKYSNKKTTNPVQYGKMLYIEFDKLLDKLNLDEKKKNKFKDKILKCGDSNKLTGVWTMVKDHSAFRKNNEFNDIPYLINCKNGVVNLKTGKLSEHRWDDYHNRQVVCKYNPNAKAPEFYKFIYTICNNNEDRVEYLQKALGYSLTGEIFEQTAYFPYGKGSDGKSVLMELMLYILNDYACALPPNIFTRGANTQFTLSQFHDFRFLTAGEHSKASEFNESLFKSVTGGDAISMDVKQQDVITKSYISKIWFATNEIPSFLNSEAMNRRIKLIPFEMKFVEKNNLPIIQEEKVLVKDKQIQNKLRNEAEGIFAWLVEGSIKYYKSLPDGLGETEEMNDIKTNYIIENIPYAYYINSYCELVAGGEEYVETLYTQFKMWHKQYIGQDTKMLPNWFSKNIQSTFNLKSKKDNKNKSIICGIKIVDRIYN